MRNLAGATTVAWLKVFISCFTSFERLLDVDEIEWMIEVLGPYRSQRSSEFTKHWVFTQSCASLFPNIT